MTPMKSDRLVQSYLFFDGRTEEAIEYYKQAVGAEVQFLMRVKDSPEPPPAGCYPEGAGDKVMHAQIRIGDTVVMLSDGRCSGKPVFQGFALSLSVRTEADVDKYFTALANGGQIQMPLAKTFFSARFGMVVDRFGVFWMVLVQPTQP